MKKALFLLPIALLGLYLVFFAQVNTAVYEVQTTKLLQEWQEQAELPELESTAHPETDMNFSQLYEAMKDYNRKIAEEKQAGLTSLDVCEQPAFCLSDYGLDDDAPIATLSIPAIDLELPVYLGASEGNLAKGGAVLGQTSLPIGGANTNCVIAGHRGYRGIPFFRNLDKLAPGDTVQITNLWGRMTYQVESVQVIRPDEISTILIQDGQDLLTLLTCHPYRVGTERLIMICKRCD